MAFLYESPLETYFSSWEKYDSFFNLIATYRLDSDAPAPYARIDRRATPLKEASLVNKPKRRPDEGPVLWMVSHCKTSSQREVYVQELAKYIKVG